MPVLECGSWESLCCASRAHVIEGFCAWEQGLLLERDSPLLRELFSVHEGNNH
jgi:hypothetical protein